MKKFVFWAMMTLGVVGLQSCDKDDDDRLQVSANLQEAFDTRYPNVSRVDWEQKSSMKLSLQITGMRTKHGLLPTVYG